MVERCLAKANVAGSSPVFRSITVPSPSGKAKVCKTFIPRFKSGWYLQVQKSAVKNDRFFCWVKPYKISHTKFTIVSLQTLNFSFFFFFKKQSELKRKTKNEKIKNKSTNKNNPRTSSRIIFLWCWWWESNPHGVATSGF